MAPKEAVYNVPAPAQKGEPPPPASLGKRGTGAKKGVGLRKK